MQVEPARLVELAGSSERVLDAMRQDWADAVEELAQACAALGDATGTANLAASYSDALADADEVLTSLEACATRAARRRAEWMPRSLFVSTETASGRRRLRSLHPVPDQTRSIRSPALE